MSLIPITDPNKRATDPKVLNIATERGWNLDFVEFSDYAKDRPYGKLYTAHETGEKVLVSSGLPMVRGTDGTKLVPGFEPLSNGKFWVKNNLFEGYVGEAGEMHLAAVNDQPTGPIAGDELHSSPVLWVGKEAISPKSVTILETDPVNPNYHDNVVEWDYGVCKRRIRVIEGRFRGTWIFPENPGADVRIEYNKTGKLNARYGYGRDAEGNRVEVQVPVNDVEYVPVSAWEGRILPVTVGDSATFYPDADAETTTVDGYATQQSSSGDTWTTIRNASGNLFNDSSVAVSCGMVYASSNYNVFKQCDRGIFLFDTSAIPDDATVSISYIMLYGLSNTNGLGLTSNLMLCSSNPSSNIGLAATDYTTLGTTSFGNGGDLSGWATGAYNTINLNASGIAVINKTGVTKLGTREGYYDALNGIPPWVSGAYSRWMAYSAEQGTGYKPRLTVIYSSGKPVHAHYYAAMRRR